MVMSWVFSGILLLSLSSALAQGNGSALSAAVAQGAQAGVTLAVSLGGSLCLWSGVGHFMERIRLSTLFITHDIDEAILLSDRIYLLAGQPGRITDEIVITQPKPRPADFNLSVEFLEYKKRILNQLENS